MDTFVILSIIRGIGHGMYWQTRHLFNTREIKGHERSKLISLIYSLETGLMVVMPLLIGAFIQETDYSWVFALGAVVYALNALYPWGYNKKPRDSLQVADLRAIMKRRGFYRWAGIMIFNEFVTNQRIMVLSVIPFLFIGSELGLGLFVSGIGLFSALLTFWHRNDNLDLKTKEGYLGGTIVTLATSGLILVWNIPAMVIRELMAQVGFALYSPVSQDYEYQHKELLVGDFMDGYSIEIQQFSEFFLFIARMINLVIFIIIFFGLQVDQEAVLKIVLTISLLRELPTLYMRVQFSQFLRIGVNPKVNTPPVKLGEKSI